MAECPFGVFVTLSLTTGLVKSFFFQNMVMMHIKLKGNEVFDNMTTYKQNFCAYKYPRSPSGVKRSKQFCLYKNGHVAYQIKENDSYSNIQAIILSLHAPLTPEMGSEVKTVFLHMY